MVHNGIEYGVMAAYAEGLNILKNANAGKVEREADAETAPLEHPEYYQYDLDLPEVAEVWRRGSVVGSWLLDLTAASMQESPDLSDFAGRVSDSGEGRWTSIAAIDEGVPAPVLTTALYERFSSRGLDDFADKVLSAMRKQFGGHDEKQRARLWHPELEVVADEQRGGPARRRADRRGGQRGRRPSAAPFALAMSGGRTPWAMLAILGELEEMPWEADRAVPGRRADRLARQRGAQPHPHGAGALDGPPGGAAADAGHPARPRGRCARVRIVSCPSASTSSTSASAPTATPPRWFPATRCSR